MCTVTIANLTIAIAYDCYIKITNVSSRITDVCKPRSCMQQKAVLRRKKNPIFLFNIERSASIHTDFSQTFYLVV